MALPSLTTRLAQAREALHSLLIGRQAVKVVDQNGETIEYKATDRRALQGYIAQLEAELAGNTATGPMKVWLK